ncbi:MAG: glucokinase [Azonexus sp.]|jgi:glucokinase
MIRLAPRVVFGPGTGLGLAALVYYDARLQPIASEDGHIGVAGRLRA